MIQTSRYKKEMAKETDIKKITVQNDIKTREVDLQNGFKKSIR